jgi:hypothetical protein
MPNSAQMDKSTQHVTRGMAEEELDSQLPKWYVELKKAYKERLEGQRKEG